MNNKKTVKKMIFQMSKQSLKASRLRNMFVMVTIALASALLTAILMFAAGQGQRVKNSLSYRPQVSYYNLTGEQVERLKKDERIACQIQVKTGIMSEMDGFDIVPYYVNELSDRIRVGELESGRLPEDGNEIALQAEVLKKMEIQPAVGSRVAFTFYDGSTETFTVSGILKGGGPAKQFALFFSGDYAENGSQLKDMPYEVHAKLYGAEEMGPEACKEAMFLIGSEAGIERKYVNPSRAFIDSLSVDIQSVMIYGLIGGVILLACVLVVYGVFYLSVVGRIHQFGQLRTIGMTKKQIQKFVSREGGILFWRSAPAGIGIGGIAGYFMIPDGFSVWNGLLILVMVAAVVFLITMVSVRKPARLAAAVSPMEALRYLPQEAMKKAKNKKMCRRLTPMGLGMMNFSKNKKKTAVTFASLGLGGILFMTAASYMSSFDKEGYVRQGDFTNAEFRITYSPAAIELNENGMSGLQAKVSMDDAFIQEIYALDGVKAVEEIKGFGVKFDYPIRDEYGNDDIVTPLTEEEIKEAGEYLEEGSADRHKLMSGDYILVAGNDTAGEIYGWKFAVGDGITLRYYDGNVMAEKEVTILGILNAQYTLDGKNSSGGWFLASEQAVLSWVSYDSLNEGILVSTEEDKENGIGEVLIQMAAERPELEIETLADRRVIYTQNTNQMFGAISGLSLFIMAFSILSMMNTLITNIVTRKQELAMLESIGMSRGQIQKMLIGESMLLVLVTVGVTMTVGTMCGFALSRALYQIGAFYMKFKFPVVFAFAYAGVLTVVPLVITFASLNGFSKETLVERLRGAEN